MCGEKMDYDEAGMEMQGSPPRMRGKVYCFLLCVRGSRITPAYAGKSSERTARYGTNGDHPRVCGEKSLLLGSSGSMGESPPHMRGKEHVRLREQHGARITPAYAGKSTPTAGRFGQCRDHPRTCGEKRVCLFLGLPLMGSPPHMRGKAKAKRLSVLPLRITPAHAGKRCSQAIRPMKKQDHPRTCGEKTYGGNNYEMPQGSPPHMRGKVCYRQSQQRRGQDHPRTCGEKSRPGVVTNSIKGSPPHMRGKGPRCPSGGHLARITPAHAGKRHRAAKWTGRCGDHPRTCGEKYWRHILFF